MIFYNYIFLGSLNKYDKRGRGYKIKNIYEA